MKIIDHKLTEATYLPSPFFNLRPNPEDLSLLVVHNISLPPKQFGGDFIEQFFLGKLEAKTHPFFDEIRDLQVSAHCLIKRGGQVIQFVPFDKRAWHAGISCFDGRDNCNDFSIGIELEGADDIVYEKVQYQRLADITRALLATYPTFSKDKIVGHQDIAPFRKTDPGPAFDWAYFHSCIG